MPKAGCLPHLFFRDRCKQRNINAVSPRKPETFWAARFTASLEVAKMILHKVLCLRSGAAGWRTTGISGQHVLLAFRSS